MIVENIQNVMILSIIGKSILSCFAFARCFSSKSISEDSDLVRHMAHRMWEGIPVHVCLPLMPLQAEKGLPPAVISWQLQAESILRYQNQGELGASDTMPFSPYYISSSGLSLN